MQKDFPSLGLLIEKFHKETIEGYGLRCDKGLMKMAIENNYKQAIVMIVDGEVVGVIGGKIIDYPLQQGKIFQEMIFYVREENRGHGNLLLEAMEKRCCENSINQMIMVLMGNSNADIMDRWYRRRGYEKLESHYIKSLL